MRDEIILHKKQEFVASHDHRRGRQQRFVRAAIGVRRDCFDERGFAVKLPKLDAHSGRRTACSEVKNMSAEFAGHGNSNFDLRIHGIPEKRNDYYSDIFQVYCDF